MWMSPEFVAELRWHQESPGPPADPEDVEAGRAMTGLPEGDADDLHPLGPLTPEVQTFAVVTERIRPLSPEEAMDE